MIDRAIRFMVYDNEGNRQHGEPLFLEHKKNNESPPGIGITGIRDCPLLATNPQLISAKTQTRERRVRELNCTMALSCRIQSRSKCLLESTYRRCRGMGETLISRSAGSFILSIPTKHRLHNESFRLTTRSFASRQEENDHDMTLLTMYEDLVQGESTEENVQHDEHQIAALTELNRLRNDLLAYEPPTMSSRETPFQQDSSIFGGFFFASATDSVVHALSTAPRGVYLHGGVGCGKTFCMNLFYDSIEGTSWDHDRQKVHYHQFMLGIHQKMHEAKMKEGIKDGDALLSHVVEQTLQSGRLLCLDEFQVTDVADALILRRLFTMMLQQGAVVVATSNRPPQDLYLNGLQRDLFLPFIDLLEEKLAVVSMWDSVVDYRLVQKAASAESSHGGGVYFVGQGAELDEFEKMYRLVTRNRTMTATKLTTLGRKVKIPQASLKKGIARFQFEDLCQKALGAADYLVIAQNFNTVFVQNVPKLHLHEINWVRRFIIFIDAMYEHHVKLVIQAQVKPEELFVLDEENEFVDEVFSFDRTVSRLHEMSSDTYLKHKWTGGETNKITPQVELMVEPS